MKIIRLNDRCTGVLNKREKHYNFFLSKDNIGLYEFYHDTDVYENFHELNIKNLLQPYSTISETLTTAKIVNLFHLKNIKRFHKKYFFRKLKDIQDRSIIELLNSGKSLSAIYI